MTNYRLTTTDWIVVEGEEKPFNTCECVFESDGKPDVLMIYEAFKKATGLDISFSDILFDGTEIGEVVNTSSDVYETTNYYFNIIDEASNEAINIPLITY